MLFLYTEDKYMNKRMKKLAAAGISAAVTLSGLFAAWPSIAANYTPVAGTSATFQKYLIMRAADTTPATTFEYAVSAGTALPAVTEGESRTMEVLAGIEPEKVTVTPAAFTAGQETFTSASVSQVDVQKTGRSGILFETNHGEKFAAAACAADFSRVHFTEPGIYRYIISEVIPAGAEQSIINEANAQRTLDVYVTDNGSGVLQISNYIMHTGTGAVKMGASNGSKDVASEGEQLSDKTDGFTSEYKTLDLAFIQTVAGNQASRDKYFALTVSLSGLTANKQYTVSLGDDGNAKTEDGRADVNIAKDPNPATRVITEAVTQPAVVTADAEGRLSQTYYLQDGQSVVIRGIPENGKYSVTEDAEDYKSTAASVNGFEDAVSSGESTILSVATGGNRTGNTIVKTSYHNVRSGVIPTGVVSTVLPGAIILSVAVLGFVVIFLGSRRRKKDHE